MAAGKARHTQWNDREGVGERRFVFIRPGH